MLKVVLVVFTVIAVVIPLMEASVSVSEVSTHPSFPGKCYDKDTHTGHAVGITFNKGCAEYTCGSDFRYQITGCFPPGLLYAPDCKEEEPDRNAPYPKCCKEFVCAHK